MLSGARAGVERAKGATWAECKEKLPRAERAVCQEKCKKRGCYAITKINGRYVLL